MGKHLDIGALAASALGYRYTLTEDALGADAQFSKRGMTLNVESGDIEGVGHWSVMRMKAPFGLIRMETLVIAPTHLDAPLINIDWVKAFGVETQIVELYDDQLRPLPEACKAEFERIREGAADLPDMPPAEERWYSSILYPFSCHKAGKGLGERFSLLAQDYLSAYIAVLSVVEPCGHAEKAEKVRAFAQRLFDEGGPAVDFISKNFGEDAARRLVLRHMYGVRQDLGD